MQLLNISCKNAVQYPKVLYLYMRKKPYLLNGHNKVSVCLKLSQTLPPLSNPFFCKFFIIFHAVLRRDLSCFQVNFNSPKQTGQPCLKLLFKKPENNHIKSKCKKNFVIFKQSPSVFFP